MFPVSWQSSFLLYPPISNPVPHLSTSAQSANAFFIKTMMSSTVLGMLQNITFRDALSQSHEAMAPKFPNSRSRITRRIHVALGLGLLHSISTQTSSHTGNNYKKQTEYETVLKTLDTRQQRAVNADSQQTENTQGEPCNCPQLPVWKGPQTVMGVREILAVLLCRGGGSGHLRRPRQLESER